MGAIVTTYEQRLREMLARTQPPPLPELYASASELVASVHIGK